MSNERTKKLHAKQNRISSSMMRKVRSMDSVHLSNLDSTISVRDAADAVKASRFSSNAQRYVRHYVLKKIATWVGRVKWNENAVSSSLVYYVISFTRSMRKKMEKNTITWRKNAEKIGDNTAVPNSHEQARHQTINAWERYECHFVLKHSYSKVPERWSTRTHWFHSLISRRRSHMEII